LGYAKAVAPQNVPPDQIITHISAKWTVPKSPQKLQSSFQLWFGIEASDGLNAIQPVLSWAQSHYEIYVEYFQVSPEKDVLTKSQPVNVNDVLRGSISLTPKRDAYFITFENLSGDKWSVNTTIPIQENTNGADLKKYTIAYFVLEPKVDCNEYSASNQATFYDIEIQYEGKTVTPQWSTNFIQDVCDCRAFVLNSTSVQLTWNSGN